LKLKISQEVSFDETMLTLSARSSTHQ